MWLRYLSERNRTLRGDRLALVDDERRLSFAELDERTSALARGLADAGLGPGDRVGLLSRNRAEVVEAYLALGKLGAAAVPINHSLVADEVEHVVRSARVAALVGEEGPITSLGSAAPELAIDFDDGRWERLAATSGERALPVVGADAVAAILFTSATTGRPKGVLVDQASLRASTLAWLATIGRADDIVFLSCTPLYHSTVTIALAYMAGGAALVLMRAFTPQLALELIERERVTHAYMVPSMIGFCLRARALERTDTGCLREIVHGAAPMPLEERAEASRAFGCALRDCYGQAEAGGAITLLDPVRDFPARADRAPRALSSCGRPLLGVEVRARDDAGAELPPDTRGELWVRSPALMRGYDANPDATAEVLRDGWLRTGDIGRVDEHGYVHLSDRRSDLVIRGGQNVYPAEVERVLREHPAVEEGAVVGRPDERWGEVPVAFVVARDGADRGELLAFAGERLAPHKRPVDVRTIDELPRNPAGKVLKKVLRETARSEEAGDGRR